MNDYQRKGKFFYTVRHQRALILCILLFFCLYRPVPAIAEDRQVEVYYFYLSVCASCRDTEQYLAEVWERCSPQLEAKNKTLAISQYNTSEKENLNLLQKFFEAYQVPEDQQHLPMVFFGESYISGESNIKLRLEKELPDAETGSPVLAGQYADTDRNAAVENFSGFKTFRTFLIGFANGLTPCSLSMLLFFISLLIARTDQHFDVSGAGLVFDFQFVVYYLEEGLVAVKIRNITFMDRGQAVILCCKLSALPIKEECILRKSIEFFSDPEPCFIHRSAVMTRILAETDEYLHCLAKDGIWEIQWAAFPEKFREMLDIGKETESIRFTG